MPSVFETYLKKIEADYRGGNATGYTYRGSLESYIESFARGIDASNDSQIDQLVYQLYALTPASLRHHDPVIASPVLWGVAISYFPVIAMRA